MVKPPGSAAACATPCASAVLSYAPAIRVAIALFTGQGKWLFRSGDDVQGSDEPCLNVNVMPAGFIVRCDGNDV